MSEYRLIPLSGKRGEGKFAKVSPEDYERVTQHSWSLNPNGYAQAWIPQNGSGRLMRMHRFILFGTADVSPLIEIDHDKNDRLDNRRDKLRVCTRSQNAQNATARTDGTSAFKGVYWHSRLGKWSAKIQAENVVYHLSCFDSEEEAARTYDACARHYHGEFAKPNFFDGETFDVREAQARARQTRGATSAYFGVLWEKRRQHWYVELRIGKGRTRKRLCYKRFSDELEAAMFYDSTVKEHALTRPLNFP